VGVANFFLGQSSGRGKLFFGSKNGRGKHFFGSIEGIDETNTNQLICISNMKIVGAVRGR